MVTAAPPVIGSIEQQDRLVARYGGTPRPERDLAAYLRGEFQAGVPFELTCSAPSATGLQLSTRLVNRLEVLSALSRLDYLERRAVTLVYVAGLPPERVAERLHIHERTLQRRIRAGLQQMVSTIYTEWRRDPPRPPVARVGQVGSVPRVVDGSPPP